MNSKLLVAGFAGGSFLPSLNLLHIGCCRSFFGVLRDIMRGGLMGIGASLIFEGIFPECAAMFPICAGLYVGNMIVNLWDIWYNMMRSHDWNVFSRRRDIELKVINEYRDDIQAKTELESDDEEEQEM